MCVPIASAWHNALSCTFPRGEAFFVESVKAFRDGVPSQLAEDIRVGLDALADAARPLQIAVRDLLAAQKVAHSREAGQQLLKQVDEVLARRKGEIARLLAEYHVPVVKRQ